MATVGIRGLFSICLFCPW